MAIRTSVTAAYAGALAEGVLLDDAAMVEAVLDDAPALPVLLADTGQLLRDAASAVAAVLPDQIAVRNCLEGAEGWVPALEADDLEAALAWCCSVLCEDSRTIPASADDQARCLAVAIALIAEMFAAHDAQAWQRFLLGRQAG